MTLNGILGRSIGIYGPEIMNCTSDFNKFQLASCVIGKESYNSSIEVESPQLLNCFLPQLYEFYTSPILYFRKDSDGIKLFGPIKEQPRDFKINIYGFGDISFANLNANIGPVLEMGQTQYEYPRMDLKQFVGNLVEVKDLHKENYAYYYCVIGISNSEIILITQGLTTQISPAQSSTTQLSTTRPLSTQLLLTQSSTTQLSTIQSLSTQPLSTQPSSTQPLSTQLLTTTQPLSTQHPIQVVPNDPDPKVKKTDNTTKNAMITGVVFACILSLLLLIYGIKQKLDRRRNTVERRYEDLSTMRRPE